MGAGFSPWCASAIILAAAGVRCRHLYLAVIGFILPSPQAQLKPRLRAQRRNWSYCPHHKNTSKKTLFSIAKTPLF